VEGIEPPLRVLETPALPLRHTEIPGADNQIRTDDLHVGNVSHYHCAIPALLFYAAKLLKRSAAYDAANAFGLISGTTLHVPLI
jgi:hypothetical protein